MRQPQDLRRDDDQLQKIRDAIDQEIILCKESFSDPDSRAFRRRRASMQSSQALRDRLRRIDGKDYGAYQSLKGE